MVAGISSYDAWKSFDPRWEGGFEGEDLEALSDMMAAAEEEGFWTEVRPTLAAMTLAGFLDFDSLPEDMQEEVDSRTWAPDFSIYVPMNPAEYRLAA